MRVTYYGPEDPRELQEWKTWRDRMIHGPPEVDPEPDDETHDEDGNEIGPTDTRRR